MRLQQYISLCAIALALAGCRDFDRDFEAYCQSFQCGEPPDAGQLTITAESVPVRLVAGKCGIASLRVRFENGEQPLERPQAEISFPPLEGRPQPSINKTNTCQEQISTVVIPEGTVTTPIFIRDELAGIYEQPLRVYFPDTDRTVEGTLPIEVVPAEPVRMSMTAAPATGRIGACVGPFDATLFDRFGNRAFATSALALELGSNSPSGTFYDSSACSSALADAGIAPDAGGLSFFYSDLQLGSLQLRASSPALDGGNALAVLEMLTAPPSRILISSAPQDVLAAACSAPFTVEFSDAFGNRVPLESAGALTFGPSGWKFYGDDACVGELTSLPLSVGTTQTTFYVAAPQATLTETVTIDLAGLTGATHVMSVTSAGASRFTLDAGSPQPFAAGSCNRLSVTATRIDGGPDTSIAVPVQLLAPDDNDAGFFFRDDVTCSGAPISSEGFDAGASVLFVYYKDRVAGSRLLRASAPGLVSHSLSVNVAAGPVTFLQLVAPPAIVEAGVCTQMRIRALDEFGNETPRTSGLRVAGAASLQSEQISAAPNCAASGTAAFAPDASTTSLYWSPRQLGASTFTVTAADGGVPGDSAVAEIVPGPPAIAFIGPGYTVQGSPGCGPTQYYIELRDKFQTPTPARALTYVSIDPKPVQTAATCQATFAYEGSACAGVEQLVFSIPDGGTRANFKFATWSASSCTYTLTAGGAFLAPTALQIRMCRNLGSPCANNGDCCTGTCGPLKLQCVP